MPLTRFARRLRGALSRRPLAADVREEMQQHLELLIERYVAEGMPAGEARAAAIRRLGNLTRIREDIHESRTLRWIETVRRDVRLTGRVLRTQRAFSAGVLVTLAIGIGANTTILSVVHAALLQPLPYDDPDQIYSIEAVIPERRNQVPSVPIPVQTFLRWRDSRVAGGELAALTPWEASLTGGGEPERVGGARVSSNFFDVLGVRVALGRPFVLEDGVSGRDRVVIISDALWHRRYGADPAVIGRGITINGENFTIVAVAPPSLLVPVRSQLHPLLTFAARIDVWKPVAPTASEMTNESWDHGVLIRIRERSAIERLRQELATILNADMRARMPGVSTQVEIRLVPLREIYAGQLRRGLMFMLGAAALLLLAACVSMANVFLARVASRANEFATRVALGATRGQILSATLAEAMTLALAGGTLGAGVGVLGVRLVTRYGPEDLGLLVEPQVTGALLLVALVVSLITGLGCGAVPAWRAYRQTANAALQESARAAVGGRTAQRTRQALVGVEMALATLLLASAALLLHSFVNVMRTDRGYTVDRVLAVDLSLFGERYAAPAARAAFYDQVLEDIRALPDVIAAGAISNLPASAPTQGAKPAIFHATDTDFERVVLMRPVAVVRSVTSGYFGASGTTLRAGRYFADSESRLVAIVSESLAARLWPGEALPMVIGREIRQSRINSPPIEVVGVVADTQPGGLDREAPPALYRPYVHWPSGPMTLVVRTGNDPNAIAGTVRAAVRRQDANMPIASIQTMDVIVASTVGERRFVVGITSAFAMVALLLGAVGVYGVVSYAVAARTREIGVRVALGAVRRDVLRLIFVEGIRPVMAGLAAGLLAAWLASSAIRGALFGVSPTDPWSLTGTVMILLASACLACYMPARRAARLHPVQALRHD